MDSAVLFVSPYSQDARILAQILDEVPVHLVHAISLKDAAAKLETARFPVVLTEANLDDGTWQDILYLTRLGGAELVVTDAWADARFWAEAINLGAYDLLAQPFQGPEVRRVLSSASSRQTEVQAGAATS